MMTKYVKKGDRIFNIPYNKPIAVAEEDFIPNEIGELDYSVTYPICDKKSVLLLPGLKKNLLVKGIIQITQTEKKCQKHKKNE